ncbi:hypothetical protein [Thiothrix sp.]|uniref:hypothetical protein n=1 Tax=Thiothrix sp. TaxID=1032 RepID=UPI00257B3ED8|nr:hypothetical protein [Thiothrix sp.]
MNNQAFASLWQKTYHTMQQARPHIELKARKSRGYYRSNLAHEWCVFLVKDVPLD